MARTPGWNYTGPVPDYGDVVVGCEQCRESLSARLDGEAELADGAEVDAHLAACVECRRWLDDAAAVNRMIRTAPVPAAIDVTDAVLAAAPGPGRARLVTALRIALGTLGVAQVGLGLVQVAALGSASDHAHDETILTGTTPGHLWHESAAWNVAIGVGFLWIATRRSTPGGIAAILSAFVAVLTLLNVNDLAAGRVEPSHLLTHAFVVSGYLIVLALTRPSLSLDRPPGGHQRARPWWRIGSRPAGETLAGPRRAAPVTPAVADPDRTRHLPAAQTRSDPAASDRKAA